MLGARVVDLTGPPELPSLVLDGREIVGQSRIRAGGPDDVALVLHTSGTTSRPKQVPLLQRNVMASVRTIVAHYELGPGDVSFCAMPLFHVHGLVPPAFSALGGGGTASCPRRFTPSAFWPQAREHAGHVAVGRPDPAPHDPRQIRRPRPSRRPALRPLLQLGAVARSSWSGPRRGTACPMLEAYGMTEASHQMASNPLPPAARLPGSVGMPTGTEIAIVDRQLRLAGRGQPGRGRRARARRSRRATSTIRRPTPRPSSTMVPDRRHRRDRDGYLRLEGRLKEMILRGGENISPSEIEQVLQSHPAVVDAVCFGVPMRSTARRWRPPSRSAAEETNRRLIEHCRQSWRLSRCRRSST